MISTRQINHQSFNQSGCRRVKNKTNRLLSDDSHRSEEQPPQGPPRLPVRKRVAFDEKSLVSTEEGSNKGGGDDDGLLVELKNKLIMKDDDDDDDNTSKTDEITVEECVSISASPQAGLGGQPKCTATPTTNTSRNNLKKISQQTPSSSASPKITPITGTTPTHTTRMMTKIDTTTHNHRQRRPCHPRKRSSSNLLNRDSITALLHDFYDDLNSNSNSKSRECWNALYEKYHSPNYIMVRPSGNILKSSGFVDMFCNADVVLLEFKMVSVDNVRVLESGFNKIAMAIYTVDQRFKFKGVLNEDRVSLTCVVEEINGDIRICHEHRCTGQPIPKSSRWDT